MKRVFLFMLTAALSATGAMAQQAATGAAGGGNAQTATDGRFLEEYNFTKLEVRERKVVPYASLRDADVVYAKILYRVIDVREKKNLPLKWEKNPMWRVLKTAAEAGEDNGYGKIRVYKSDSLIKENALTVQKVRELGSVKTTIDFPIDPDDPDRVIQKDTIIPFEWYKIVRYRIKEEWIFDKQRSEFFCRIIGIAPTYDKEIPGSDVVVPLDLCWFDYKDLRQTFVTQELFNRQNDAMRLSYLDFFEYRLFSSYITGESNAMAYETIMDNPEFKDNPMAALYESERIKNDLFTWEHDLWEY